MPPRSKIALLPEPIREQLNQKLISSAFSDYTGLSQWLEAQGYEICRSSVHVYGQELEEKLNEIERMSLQAKAIATHLPDDENLIGEALSILAQTKAFQVLKAMDNPGEINLPTMIRAIADLNRSSINIKKYRLEITEKAKAAATKVRQLAGGISEETLREIERTVLGIAE